MSSFQVGDTKFERFLPKNQHIQRKLLNLVIKWFKNWCYQIMSITKNVPLNLYSSIKKLRKIRMIFDAENWLWKSNFGTVWHLPLHQFAKFNDFIWPQPKTFLILYPSHENFTTSITINMDLHTCTVFSAPLKFEFYWNIFILLFLFQIYKDIKERQENRRRQQTNSAAASTSLARRKMEDNLGTEQSPKFFPSF